MPLAPIPPGNYLTFVRSQVERARRSGALEPIATDLVPADEGGVPWQLRTLGAAARKPRGLPSPGGPAPSVPAKDPFSPPWEADLVVGGVGPGHACLLNKFPVFDAHALLVTVAFEAQESLLGPADWAAARWALDEADVLVFYNSSVTAGASQPHKHLQVVPCPLGAGGRVPLEARLVSGDVPFVRALRAMPPSADEAHRVYGQALAEAGVGPGGAYNLLATRDWLCVVPRSAEAVAGHSLNALAYAGSLFAKTRDGLEQLRALGLFEVLARAGVRRG